MNMPMLKAISEMSEAETRASALMREAYPVGSKVIVIPLLGTEDRVTGKIAAYFDGAQIVSGVIVQFSDEDLKKIPEWQHLKRYEGWAEIPWYKIESETGERP
jgi:hypothetical protein